MERYEELLRYKKENGNVCVARNAGSLGNWVSKQRQNRQSLTEEQKQLLEEVGFVWKMRIRKEYTLNGTKEQQKPKYQSWDERYQQCREYYDEHGHTFVTKQENPLLNQWILHQRILRKKNLLTIKQLDLLEDIEFIWDGLEYKWQRQYDQLKGFKERYGHLLIPMREKTALNRWVGTQRSLYKQGKLRPDRVDALESLGFCWNAQEEAWIRQFSSQNNTQWQSRQRMEKKNYDRGYISHLSPERQQLLEQLPGWSWDTVHEQQWRANFLAIRQFYKEHGHLQLKSPKALAVWLRDQRQQYRAYTKDPTSSYLTQERIHLLETLNFQQGLIKNTTQQRKKKKQHINIMSYNNYNRTAVMI